MIPLGAAKTPLSFRVGGSDLLVAAINTSIDVNGPGKRLVVHLQGCNLGCTGCFNRELWPAVCGSGVAVMGVGALVRRINDDETTGVTFSGGEPFQQGLSFFTVLTQLRQLCKPPTVMIFTGYTLEELDTLLPSSYRAKIFACVDVLVSGRFERSELDVAADSYAATSNQRVTRFSDRISAKELHRTVQVDILTDGAGSSVVTGFPSDSLVDKFLDRPRRTL